MHLNDLANIAQIVAAFSMIISLVYLAVQIRLGRSHHEPGLLARAAPDSGKPMIVLRTEKSLKIGCWWDR